MGVTSGTAKQAFDALVQRDAPDANRGRSFARFETKFQLAWVVGAAMPLLVRVPAGGGLHDRRRRRWPSGLISYWLGQRRVARGTYDWESPSRKLFRRGLRKVDASLAPAARAAAASRRGPTVAADGGPTGRRPARRRRGGAARPLGAGRAPAASPARRPAAGPDRRHRRRCRPPWTPPPGFVSEPLVSSPDRRPHDRCRPTVFDGEADLAADYVAELAAALAAPTAPGPAPGQPPTEPEPARGAASAARSSSPTLPLDVRRLRPTPAIRPPPLEPRWRDSPR